MHWVAATVSLKLSGGFSKPEYVALTLLCFGVAFFVMSLVVQTMPIGIASSVWSGGGIAGVTLLGALVSGQLLDGYAFPGIGLTLAGVVVLNTLSTAAGGQELEVCPHKTSVPRAGPETNISFRSQARFGLTRKGGTRCH